MSSTANTTNQAPSSATNSDEEVTLLDVDKAFGDALDDGAPTFRTEAERLREVADREEQHKTEPCRCHYGSPNCGDDHFAMWELEQERGWSRSMIRKLLGAPDKTEQGAINRMSIRKLYFAGRVVNAEQTGQFTSLKAQFDKRSEATKKRQIFQNANCRTYLDIVPVWLIGRRWDAGSVNLIRKVMKARKEDRARILGGLRLWRTLDGKRSVFVLTSKHFNEAMVMGAVLATVKGRRGREIALKDASAV